MTFTIIQANDLLCSIFEEKIEKNNVVDMIKYLDTYHLDGALFQIGHARIHFERSELIDKLRDFYIEERIRVCKNYKRGMLDNMMFVVCAKQIVEYYSPYIDASVEAFFI